MVAAGQDLRVALFLIHDRICTVSADVVECIDLPVAITGDDNVESGNLIAEPFTGFSQPVLVSSEKPFSGKDGSSLELVKLF